MGASNSPNAAIKEALALIFKGIKRLTDEFPNRKFTIDGRLVGDIGEVIAALKYEIVLDEVCGPDHDAKTFDGRGVQIKATFKNHLTFKSIPDYYLGFKLYSDGRHEEIFNGPGQVIFDRYKHRKDIGVRLLAFPLSELRKLSEKVAPLQRVLKRDAEKENGAN
jgi:hypothetical protein